ncbi:MAG TPA: YfhO family protein [Candidatus Xenobia bacterium]
MTWVRKHATAAAVAFFLLVTIVMGSPFLFGSRFFLAADFLYRTPLWYDPSVPLHNFDLLDGILIFYPDETVLHHALQRGEFALWNPHNLSGVPIFADGQSGFFYPIRILLFLLASAPVAHDLGILLHLWAAGIMMFLLARRLGLGLSAALLAGTVWMLNGVSATWLTNEVVALCLPYVPLLIILLEKARENRRWVFAVALATAAMLTTGHLQIVLNCGFIAVVMGVYRWWTGTRKGAAWALLGLALGGGLASPLLLPTADLVSRSERPAIQLDYLISCQQKFLAGFVPTVWMPDSLGTPVDGFAINRVPDAGYFVYLETCAYCGVVPLLLALAGARRPGLGRFLAIFALAAVVVPATPLYRLFYLLPIFKILNPTRLILCWVFSVALLAGLGLEEVETRRRWIGGVGTVVLLAMGAVVLCMPSQLGRLLELGWVRLPAREMYLSQGEWLAAAHAGFDRVYRPLGPDMALPILWLSCGLLALWRWPRRAVFILLSAGDLLWFGLRFNTADPGRMIYAQTPTIEYLQANVGLDRVMGVGAVKPNTLLPFEVNDVGGYGSLYSKLTSNYWTWSEFGDLAPQHRFANQLFPLRNYRSPLVNLMGVRYFVTYPQDTLPGYPKVQDAPLPVYENPHRLPRAWVVPAAQVVAEDSQLAVLSDPGFDPRRTVLLTEAGPGTGTGGEAHIVSYDLQDVVIETQGGGGYLVLSDTWDPGWKATVDGQPTQVLRADYVLRAVPIEKGAHRIEFRYAPRELFAGAWMAAASLLVGLGLCVRPRSTPTSAG